MNINKIIKKKSTLYYKNTHPFPTSLISGRNLCKNSCLCKQICYVMPPTHLQLMCQLAVNFALFHTIARALTNGGMQLVQYAPSIFPAKSAGTKWQSHSKPSSNWPSPENFLVFAGSLCIALWCLAG